MILFGFGMLAGLALAGAVWIGHMVLSRSFDADVDRERRILLHLISDRAPRSKV